MFIKKQETQFDNNIPPLPPHHVPCAEIEMPAKVPFAQKAAVFAAAFLGAFLGLCAAILVQRREAGE